MKLENCAELFRSFCGGRLFAGFSGGADSTALLLAAHEFQPRFGYELTAVHFDHGVRPESAAEAEGARRFAEERGIPFQCVTLNLSGGANLEARAREARLAYWRQTAADKPGTAVLLGHNRDDRVENLFLRLGRGSNTSGLTGLRQDVTVAGVRILRPLLQFSRSEIEEFLHSRNIFEWQNDSSNAANEYERNFLRNRLLAEWSARTPAIRSALARSLEVLELDAHFLEKEAQRLFLQISASAETPLCFWRSLDPALLPRVLRYYLAEHFPQEPIPAFDTVERFTAFLKNRSAEKRLLPLGGDFYLELRGDIIKPFQDQAIPPDLTWNWRKQHSIRWGGFCFEVFYCDTPPEPDLQLAFFDAELLPETLIIGMRRAGDRIIPFGKTSPLPLKKLRSDRKIPAERILPVLRTAENAPLLWAVGIRHSATAPVTAAGGRIAVFKCFCAGN